MSVSNSDHNTLKQCRLCKKEKKEVELLIQTLPEMIICSDCVETLYDMVQAQRALSNQKSNRKPIVPISTPREIVRLLDKHVIGQEYAKKTFAVGVYKHYKRVNSIHMPLSDQEQLIQYTKSNILFIGPSGSGKTYIPQIFAEHSSVPFTIVDATTLTEAGYVGEDVESILQRLYQAADCDIARTERGIVFIDEIDKLSRRSDNPSITRDVSGEGVQQALLKLLEGTEAAVPLQGSRKHPHQETVTINTTNILFICGGTFEGLEKIIRGRMAKFRIGFSSDIQENTNKKPLESLAHYIETEDLIKYGLTPELIGRLPVIASLEELTKDQLVQVLVEPENSLVKQYVQLFKLDNVELIFEPEALQAIAQKAIARKTGARGLRAVLESHLLELMYDIPSRDDIAQVIISRSFIVDGTDPTIIYRNKSQIEKEATNG